MQSADSNLRYLILLQLQTENDETLTQLRLLIEQTHMLLNLQYRVERLLAAVTLWLFDANYLGGRFSFDTEKVQEKIIDLLESFCSFHVIWLSTLLNVARNLNYAIKDDKKYIEKCIM